MNKIEERKKKLENTLYALGYNELRISIFNKKNEYREEWQTRIEYDEESKEYQVYSLADRAGLIGKVRTYTDYEEAEVAFLKLLDLTIKYNKLRIKNNESPEYPCPLWDDVSDN